MKEKTKINVEVMMSTDRTRTLWGTTKTLPTSFSFVNFPIQPRTLHGIELGRMKTMGHLESYAIRKNNVFCGKDLYLEWRFKQHIMNVQANEL